MKSNQKATETIVSDHTAKQIVRMAKEFFSKGENIKNFERWHLETYGHPFREEEREVRK